METVECQTPGSSRLTGKGSMVGAPLLSISSSDWLDILDSGGVSPRLCSPLSARKHQKVVTPEDIRTQYIYIDLSFIIQIDYEKHLTIKSQKRSVCSIINIRKNKSMREDEAIPTMQTTMKW